MTDWRAMSTAPTNKSVVVLLCEDGTEHRCRYYGDGYWAGIGFPVELVRDPVRPTKETNLCCPVATHWRWEDLSQVTAQEVTDLDDFIAKLQAGETVLDKVTAEAAGVMMQLLMERIDTLERCVENYRKVTDGLLSALKST